MKSYASKDNDAMALYQAYLKGDDSAFSKIYDMYIGMMLGYGSCLSTNKELVRDCVHDVFVRLLDRSRAPKVQRMSSYLIISLRNRLLDEFRRDTYSSEQPVELLFNRKSDVEVEQNYIMQEQDDICHQQVSQLMESLTPRQRMVFQLYYLEEMKYDDICQIMGMNYHSVRNLVHRGMIKLREAAVTMK